VLDQSLEVANDLGRNPRLFDDAPQYSYLTRRAPTDSAADRRPYEWAHADLEFGPCTRVPAPDEVTAARISRLPINADVEWEVALVAGAGALQEDPRDRPELMLTLLVVDRESTFVLHGEPLRASTALEAIQPAFAGLLLRTGFAPRRILVRNPAQRDQLAPIAKLAGSRLLRVQRLPSLEEVSDDLKALMRGQPVQP
jgi:hypothetical protein